MKKFNLKLSFKNNHDGIITWFLKYGDDSMIASGIVTPDGKPYILGELNGLSNKERENGLR